MKLAGKKLHLVHKDNTKELVQIVYYPLPHNDKTYRRLEHIERTYHNELHKIDSKIWSKMCRQWKNMQINIAKALDHNKKEVALVHSLPFKGLETNYFEVNIKYLK